MTGVTQQMRAGVWKHACVLSAILGVAVLHFLTPISWHHLHALVQRLYYLPILLAGYWFGLRGALIYVSICALLYVPHLVMQWPNHHEVYALVVELGMFFVVGSFTGFIFDARRRQSASILRQQEAMAQAERLSLVGRMAAGLAHEIRNPLASLLGSADILQRGFAEGNPDPEFADLILHDLKRLDRIVNDFLRFARPRKAEAIPLSPVEVIQGALALAASTLNKMGVHVAPVYDADLPLCWMDGEQIKQILFNLLLNAAEAMPQGGTVQLELARRGDFIVVVVQDSGPGLSIETAKHLFEPFYTTKEKGTGLGLAISKQLAEGCGGSLAWIPSAQGARFDLVLPIHNTMVIA